MKLNSLKLAVGAAILSGALATPALADGLSGTAAVTTNYLFRGITQTLDKPTVQASIGYAFGDSGFSVGAWGSGIDFGDGKSSLESDYYANYAFSMGDLGVTLGATEYAYPTSKSGWDYDYFEASVALAYPVGPGSLTGSAWYSPAFFGGADGAWYFQGGYSLPLCSWLSAAGNYGYQTIDTPGYFFGTDSYSTWNLGVTGTYDKYSLNLLYSQTDLPSFGGLADAKFVVTLSAAF